MTGRDSPTRRSLCLGLLAVLTLWAAAPAARAADFLGGDWTTGSGYRGFDVKGGLNLDAQGAWEGDATYAYAHSRTGTESRSNQLTLILAHIVDDRCSTRASMTGWRDTLNDVQYFGPSFGITYAAFDRPDDRVQGARGAQWLRVSLDSDLFVYQAGQTISPKVIKVSRTETAVIPAGQGSVSLAQWHPSFLVERPLMQEKLTPWVRISHDFYSKNPNDIEARAGQPQFSASANSLNGLVGGLLIATGEIGLSVALPAHLKLTASIGLEQEASDNKWATSQNAGLSGLYLDRRCRIGVSWARSIQDGVVQDLLTTGLSWFF